MSAELHALLDAGYGHVRAREPEKQEMEGVPLPDKSREPRCERSTGQCGFEREARALLCE